MHPYQSTAFRRPRFERARVALAAIAALLALPHTLRAQAPVAVPTTAPAVAPAAPADPRHASIAIAAAQPTQTVAAGTEILVPFSIRNLGTAPTSVVLTPFCAQPATAGCAAAVLIRDLAPGTSTELSVTSIAGLTAGQQGTVSLTASSPEMDLCFGQASTVVQVTGVTRATPQPGSAEARESARTESLRARLVAAARAAPPACAARR